MKSAYEILKERGFVEQVTDEALITELFADGPVTCYIGFDPTATSLHIGSLVPIMALAHMQQTGNQSHCPGRRRHRSDRRSQRQDGNAPGSHPRAN